MNTLLQPHRRGSSSTVLLVLGGVFMVLALIFSVAFYIWGQNAPSAAESWNDLISAIFIVYAGIPIFVIGLILFIIGLVLRIRRRAA